MTMKAMRMEKATLISTTKRHALGAGGGKHEPVLERHEADHLTHGVLPRHHHQQSEQHHRQREGEVFTHQRVGAGGDAQHHHHGQRNEPHAEQHGGADPDHRLDLAVNAELDDHPVQHDWDQHRLEQERDRRGDVEVRRILCVGLPCHR